MPTRGPTFRGGTARRMGERGTGSCERVHIVGRWCFSAREEHERVHGPPRFDNAARGERLPHAADLRAIDRRSSRTRKARPAAGRDLKGVRRASRLGASGSSLPRGDLRCGPRSMTLRIVPASKRSAGRRRGQCHSTVTRRAHLVSGQCLPGRLFAKLPHWPSKRECQWLHSCGSSVRVDAKVGQCLSH